MFYRNLFSLCLLLFLWSGLAVSQPATPAEKAKALQLRVEARDLYDEAHDGKISPELRVEKYKAAIEKYKQAFNTAHEAKDLLGQVYCYVRLDDQSNAIERLNTYLNLLNFDDAQLKQNQDALEAFKKDNTIKEKLITNPKSTDLYTQIDNLLQKIQTLSNTEPTTQSTASLPVSTKPISTAPASMVAPSTQGGVTPPSKRGYLGFYGVGGALLITGGGFLLGGVNANRTTQTLIDQNDPRLAESIAAQNKYTKTLNTIGWGCISAGVLSAGTGWLSAKKAKKEPTTVIVTPSGVTIAGSF